MAYYRQSKRRTAEFLTTPLGQPCCPSLTVKIQKQVTAAVRSSYEALAAKLPKQDRMGPVRRKIERLLLRGTQCGPSDTRDTCRELYEHRCGPSCVTKASNRRTMRANVPCVMR